MVDVGDVLEVVHEVVEAVVRGDGTDHHDGLAVMGGGGSVTGCGGGPHTLNTIFMLWVVHLPPILLCRSSLVDVEMK